MALGGQPRTVLRAAAYGLWAAPWGASPGLARTLKGKLRIWQSLLSTGTTVTPRHSQQ